MRYLIYCCIFFSLSFCIKNKLTNPPGTVQVSDNLYVDSREAANIDYREYLYWLGIVFGEKSSEYISAQPDREVWQKTELPNKAFLEKHYFDNPFYNNYPVVGVSWEQANNYMQWRTDRVYEMSLVEKGIIAINPNQKRGNYFTYRKYRDGEYLNIKPDKLPPLAVYGLPSIEVWEQFADAMGDIDMYPYGTKKTKTEIKKLCNKKKCYFNTRDNGNIKSKNKKQEKPITVQTNHYKPNKLKIYNTIGNVCEMTREKGTAKGGSWKHGLDECEIQKNIEYSAPESWLGFRAVCRWVEIDRN